MELDQAAALGRGILTVFYSVCDAFVSYKVTRWENYYKWRINCQAHFEGGILTEDETNKWIQELQIIALQE